MLKNIDAENTDNRIVVELSQVYEAPDGENLKVLILRKPTAGDFVHVGAMPVEINLAAENIEPKFNPVAMTGFLSRLSDQPPVFIRKLTPADWLSAAWAVAPFFVPGMPTSS